MKGGGGGKERAGGGFVTLDVKMCGRRETQDGASKNTWVLEEGFSTLPSTPEVRIPSRSNHIFCPAQQAHGKGSFVISKFQLPSVLL